MLSPTVAVAWEALWAPYDEPTYQVALSHIPPGAVVLDIGAGDLRFARRAAQRAALIYAVECRPELLPDPSSAGLPDNLVIICADARTWPFPPGIDTAVLLMRHCTEFGRYVRKLQAVGCRRLITNARWGMGVESIALSQPARPYAALDAGWYACRCGATGFREGPAATLSREHVDRVVELSSCPACAAAPAFTKASG